MPLASGVTKYQPGANPAPNRAAVSLACPLMEIQAGAHNPIVVHQLDKPDRAILC